MSFDLKVQHRNAKTGQITEVNPYRLHISGNKKLYERPVGSGNLWFEDGKPANEHKEYEVPKTGRQLFDAQISAKDSQLRTMSDDLKAKDKELAAIKLEAEAKVAAATEKKPEAKEVKNGKKAGNANPNDKK